MFCTLPVKIFKLVYETTLPPTPTQSPQQTIAATPSKSPQQTLAATPSKSPQQTLAATPSKSPQQTPPPTPSKIPQQTLAATPSKSPQQTLAATLSKNPQQTLAATSNHISIESPLEPIRSKSFTNDYQVTPEPSRKESIDFTLSKDESFLSSFLSNTDNHLSFSLNEGDYLPYESSYTIDSKMNSFSESEFVKNTVIQSNSKNYKNKKMTSKTTNIILIVILCFEIIMIILIAFIIALAYKNYKYEEIDTFMEIP